MTNIKFFYSVKVKIVILTELPGKMPFVLIDTFLTFPRSPFYTLHIPICI